MVFLGKLRGRGAVHIGVGQNGEITVVRPKRLGYWPMRILQKGNMRERPFIKALHKVVRTADAKGNPGDMVLQVTKLRNLWYALSTTKGRREHIGGYGKRALWELTRELHNIAAQKNRALAPEAQIKRIETFETGLHSYEPPWGWRVKDRDTERANWYTTDVMDPREFEKRYPRPVADAAHGKKTGAGE